MEYDELIVAGEDALALPQRVAMRAEERDSLYEAVRGGCCPRIFPTRQYNIVRRESRPSRTLTLMRAAWIVKPALFGKCNQ